MYKKSKASFFYCFLIVVLFGCKSDEVVYKNKNASVEDRINDLLKRMTLKEKIAQLNQYVYGNNNNPNNLGDNFSVIPGEIGSLIYFDENPQLRNKVQKKAIDSTRLGIPILFGYDNIHGFRTVYPIPLAQACSWNPDLVSKNCASSGKEAVLSGVDWTFAPMIDVSRDPRWGRVSECYGEDAYVNSVFGVASVKGFQGKKLSDPYSIAACLKHYVGYGASEGGRDYRYSEISKQALWDTYLPPYEACVNVGAATLMSGFNDISGIPSTANPYTLTEVLKKRWKHDGFVVSDWDAVDQLVNQGVAKDTKEAALKAFTAGVEMDMKDSIYYENLEALVAENKIPMHLIDASVGRILRVKFRLGLFEEPYTPITTPEERFLQKSALELASQLVEESIVLLKNKSNILPLDKKKIKSIAVIGPLAKDKNNLLGSWSAHGKKEDVESIYEGIEKEFKEAKINYAKGSSLDGNDETGFEAALKAANESDVILLCLGENRRWSGENASRSTIALPAIQEKLALKLKETKKPIILILSNGRPLELVRLEPISDAIVEIWQPGISGGSPLAGILSGKINPSGKLAITFPLTTGQIPIYYSMRPSARVKGQGDYQDISTTPLYWFGHGLSYTNYNYKELSVSKKKFTKNDTITATITIENTGDRDGKETVFWYVSDPYASISRPRKELRFFEKKEIKKGEKSTFKFEIDPLRDLSYNNSEGNKILEEGVFYIIVNDKKIEIELVK